MTSVKDLVFPRDSARGKAARRAAVKLNRRRRRLAERRNEKATHLIRSELASWARSRPCVQVIQIGSHNGSDGDPIAELIDLYPSWRAVFVEPTPDQFAALATRRGADSGHQLVRAAITTHDGEVTMTTVDRTPDMPEWADQLSSIHADTVMSHAGAIPDLDQHVRQLTVPAMTFPTLLERCGIGQFDLLHIDTEGHDATILDMVDLDWYRPEVVMFEHKHLSALDRRRCDMRLNGAGYSLISDGMDTLAMRRRSTEERRRGRRST